MRYYNFVLNTNAEKIEAGSKIRLKEFSYDSAVNAFNVYMYRTLKNSINFLAYLEEESALHCIFSHDDTKISFEETYDYICEILKDTFDIRKILSEPEEITMYDCFAYIQEARRRDLMSGVYRIAEDSNLWLYHIENNNEREILRYDFEEQIIPTDAPAISAIYDPKFMEELDNIEKHKNTSDFNGNMVHYIISARSMDAAVDMTSVLAQKLYQANRITSRRLEIVRNLKPDVYHGKSYLEEVIENNFGGAVVFDLTERFGYEATEYGNACIYLESLLKKYRNKCLFIFTYNMDQPGFSYQLLPNLMKYVLPVTLKEGSGNRRSAIKYLEGLIKSSELCAYSDKAEEFMKRFPGNEFTQTEVLSIYEKFEPWCLCNNVYHIPYSESDEFLLDYDKEEESPYAKLQGLIGLKPVKKQIDEILTNNLVEKERKRRLGGKEKSSCMHMIFAGNPGTAKTTVAKLFAGICKEKGILKSGAFVDCSGVKLNGNSQRVRDAFLAAKGGVLFIDEAYELSWPPTVTTLIQEMEERREDVIVVFAGYNDKMKDFSKRNEGLKSRIPYWVDFPDYSEEELTKIFEYMLKDHNLTATKDAISEAGYLFSKALYRENFGNGRYVRNLIENAKKKQAVRLLPLGKNAGDIRKKDLFRLTKADIADPDDSLIEEREPGSALKELDEMVGLTSVKEVIHKAVANFRMNKLLKDRGISKDKASYHMVFTGNPGTAKTTVARLFAEIMKDEKVLPTGVFKEVGRADLVGPFAGTTPILVQQKFKEARGGVLFIDEAYSLCDSYKNGFGDEAINTIVQEMENHRDEVIVIFAGYPEPMKEFLERNPGMNSRIAFHVNFDDYSKEDLCGITKLMLSKKNLKITDEAFDKLRGIYKEACQNTDFGNGRFVRKMLEEAEMNLSQRLADFSLSDITDEMLTTIEASDIPEFTPSTKNTCCGKIGFAS